MAIWTSSASNRWSAVYPCLLVVGVVVVLVLSLIRAPGVRRTAIIVTSLCFVGVCTEATYQSMSEKWRIRHEWTEKNWDSLTKQQQEISISDDANLLMKPPFHGLSALACFISAMMMASIVRRT